MYVFLPERFSIKVYIINTPGQIQTNTRLYAYKYNSYLYRTIHILNQRERDYYSKNLSILNISSYSEWNLFLDAKILITREIIILLKS